MSYFKTRITLKHEEIVELRRRKFAELALLDEWVIKCLLNFFYSFKKNEQIFFI